MTGRTRKLSLVSAGRGEVRLVVTCAKEKTVAVPPRRHLSAVPAGDLGSRAARWVRCLSRAGESLPAVELYRGQHWVSARAAGELADSAWIASAGYGLIPFDAPVAPYTATFALGDADSVVPPSARSKPADPADWWDAIAEWPGPVPGSPRRLSGLTTPDGFLLVAASVSYLRAMARDLRVAADKAPGRVAVICGGAAGSHPLADVLLPCDARLQAVVGGSLTALNARVAHRLLADPPPVWTFAAARDKLDGWLAAAPVRERVARRGLDDEEVVAFIDRQLSVTPAASPTALLRVLRGRGLACEASRFARLYKIASEA